MSVRGKFRVQKVAKTCWGTEGSAEITFGAEYDPTIAEDKKYAQATPSGSITMYVDNPKAVEQLTIGKYFYVDFTEVPKAVAAGE